MVGTLSLTFLEKLHIAAKMKPKSRSIQYLCSDPSREGGGSIFSDGFFVQTILADRYIHGRELRLVSLESLSSVEYGKNMFFNFNFYRELSRFKLLRKVE